MHPHRYFSALICAYIGYASSPTLPTPVICEDSIAGQPPFNSNDTPCLLGCDVPIAVATGSLLPGSVNLTNIPYCQLDCVHDNATPSQSALAPGCYSQCQVHNQATPENIGWCMYWCVDGYGDLVATTACVPSLEYGPTFTSIIGTRIETIQAFTHPAAWESWYETQTVISRTGNRATLTAAPSTSIISGVGPSSGSGGSRLASTLSGSQEATHTSAAATAGQITQSDVAAASPSLLQTTSASAGAALSQTTLYPFRQLVVSAYVIMVLLC